MPDLTFASAPWVQQCRRVKGRAIWPVVVALALASGGLGLSVAFDPNRGTPHPKSEAPGPVTSITPGLAEARGVPQPFPDVDTAPAESVVVDFRRRTLNPEPQRQPSSVIAVSGSRIGRIEADALVVVDPEAPRKKLTLTLPGAFTVAAAPGTLLAAGKDRLLVLGPGERTPKSMPRPSLLPGSRLMPDLIDAARIWVHHPKSNSLFGYELEQSDSPLLHLVDTAGLSGNGEGSFLALADGSFLNFTGGAWERLFVQGKRSEIPWPKSKPAPFRALRAERLDQFYVLFSDGLLELYQLGTPLVRVWHRNVGALPVDVATSGNTVFLLRAERPERGELTWTLQVIHRKRQDVVIPLGGNDAEAFMGEWHPRMLARYGLAASPRWVALGGTGQLRVWDAKTLEPVDVGQ